jgi:hypothetical protein
VKTAFAANTVGCDQFLPPDVGITLAFSPAASIIVLRITNDIRGS